MSGSLEKESEWTYRIFTRRIITVNAKNEQVRKVTATDLSTKLVFGIDVPPNASLESVEVGKPCFASLKVYTMKNIEGVSAEFAEFFHELDVDQSAEDFLKAYWVYPKQIKFELVEIEPAE